MGNMVPEDASEDLQRVHEVLTEQTKDETVEWGKTRDGQPTIKVSWTNGDDLKQEVYESKTFPGDVDIVSTGIKTHDDKGFALDDAEIYIILREVAK